MSLVVEGSSITPGLGFLVRVDSQWLWWGRSWTSLSQGFQAMGSVLVPEVEPRAGPPCAGASGMGSSLKAEAGLELGLPGQGGFRHV